MRYRLWAKYCMIHNASWPILKALKVRRLGCLSRCSRQFQAHGFRKLKEDRKCAFFHALSSRTVILIFLEEGKIQKRQLRQSDRLCKLTAQIPVKGHILFPPLSVTSWVEVYWAASQGHTHRRRRSINVTFSLFSECPGESPAPWIRKSHLVCKGGVSCCCCQYIPP